jgi:hypothetical protein
MLYDAVVLRVFLEPRRLAEKALTAVVQEGLRARRIDALPGRHT